MEKKNRKKNNETHNLKKKKVEVKTKRKEKKKRKLHITQAGFFVVDFFYSPSRKETTL